jgi:RNA polymerase sigma-70 factor (ECF subfamily)
MYYAYEQHTPNSQAAVVPDGILVGMALQGDQRAFESLVDRYSSSLLSYTRHLLNDGELAYDVLQHAFLQLYVSLPILKRNVPVRAWLFQVAHNRCLDELRNQQRRHLIQFSALEQVHSGEELSAVESIPDLRPLPEEVAEQHDQWRLLQQALCALSPRIRLIVYLHSCRELSFSEIAGLLNMPVPSVKAYFYRSLSRLRTALVAQGYTASKEKKDVSTTMRTARRNNSETDTGPGRNRRSVTGSPSRGDEPTASMAIPCTATTGRPCPQKATRTSRRLESRDVRAG